MRYSFHGKVRATGQQVDGYVEAPSSSDAIDRLADQGIIGVYSVRPEPRAPQNAVLVTGTKEWAAEEARAVLAEKQGRLPGPARQAAPQPQPIVVHALPAPVAPAAPPSPPQIVYVPMPTPVAGTAPPAVAGDGASDSILTSLVDKVALLLTQVEKLLSRPAQVVYAAGGGGGGTARGGGKKSSKNLSDSQNSTLKDIFATNLALRRSLANLDTAVGAAPAAGTPAPAGPALESVPAIVAAAEAVVGEIEAASFEPSPTEAAAEPSEEVSEVMAVEPEPIEAFDPAEAEPSVEPEVIGSEPDTSEPVDDDMGEEPIAAREMPAKVMREMPGVRDRSRSAQPAA